MASYQLNLKNSAEEISKYLSSGETRFNVNCELEFNDNISNSSTIEVLDMEILDEWFSGGEIAQLFCKQYLSAKNYIALINKIIENDEDLTVEEVKENFDMMGDVKPYDEVTDKDLWIECSLHVYFDEIDPEDLPINEKFTLSSNNISIEVTYPGGLESDSASEQLTILEDVDEVIEVLDTIIDDENLEDREVNLSQKANIEIKEV